MHSIFISRPIPKHSHNICAAAIKFSETRANERTHYAHGRQYEANSKTQGTKCDGKVSDYRLLPLTPCFAFKKYFHTH